MVVEPAITAILAASSYRQPSVHPYTCPNNNIILTVAYKVLVVIIRCDLTICSKPRIEECVSGSSHLPVIEPPSLNYVTER